MLNLKFSSPECTKAVDFRNADSRPVAQCHLNPTKYGPRL